MLPILSANDLIKPNPGLMFWTLITFVIVLLVLKRYAFGPIQKTIDERRERIRQSLDEADNAREEARKLLEEHRRLIGQARAEAEEIRQEVRQDSEALREQARQEIDADRQRRLDETKRQIEAETARSIAQIRAEIAELTYLAASKVTGKSLDSADQRRLIDEAIASLDFSVLEEKAPA